MRVLIALDTSEIGESAAAAMAAWLRSVPIELHVLSVVHPDDLHVTEESPSTGEFPVSESSQAGDIPLMTGSQFGQVVVPLSDPRPVTVEYRGQAIERARSEREDYLRALVLRDLPDANATVHVEFSDRTAQTIVETAKVLGVDAIAMGTHGKTGIRHALVGSVAEEVVRRAQVPVVLIGPEAHAVRA